MYMRHGIFLYRHYGQGSHRSLKSLKMKNDMKVFESLLKPDQVFKNTCIFTNL